jgi:hypothetical protein
VARDGFGSPSGIVGCILDLISGEAGA